jgi:hypothetical protein
MDALLGIESWEDIDVDKLCVAVPDEKKANPVATVAPVKEEVVSTTNKMVILKRDPNAALLARQQQNDVAEKKSEKSAAQREREYEEARARIFSSDEKKNVQHGRGKQTNSNNRAGAREIKKK